MKLSELQPPVPGLRLFSRAVAQVAAPQLIGKTSSGELRVVPIPGGRLEGRLSGEILPGGSDLQIVTTSGVA